MMKEKIIDVFTKNSDCPDGTHRTLNKYQQNRVADELLELFEQEEEEMFKNTLIKLIKFFNFNQNETEASYSMGEIEDVIREFAEINGVEL